MTSPSQGRTMETPLSPLSHLTASHQPHPGPGHYDPHNDAFRHEEEKAGKGPGTAFSRHEARRVDAEAARRRSLEEPSPADYTMHSMGDPHSGFAPHGGRLGLPPTQVQMQLDMYKLAMAGNEPGPSSYSAGLYGGIGDGGFDGTRGGGTQFGEGGDIATELDALIARAEALPGPGYYKAQGIADFLPAGGRISPYEIRNQEAEMQVRALRTLRDGETEKLDDIQCTSSECWYGDSHLHT